MTDLIITIIFLFLLVSFVQSNDTIRIEFKNDNVAVRYDDTERFTNSQGIIITAQYDYSYHRIWIDDASGMFIAHYNVCYYKPSLSEKLVLIVALDHNEGVCDCSNPTIQAGVMNLEFKNSTEAKRFYDWWKSLDIKD